MKLSMSTSSSKSTVKMYLIQILLALLRLANWKLGFWKIKRIETMDPGPQYYHITSHYETLRIFAGLQILLLESAGSDCLLVNHAGFRISDRTCRTSTQGGSEARLLDGS